MKQGNSTTSLHLLSFLPAICRTSNLCSQQSAILAMDKCPSHPPALPALKADGRSCEQHLPGTQPRQSVKPVETTTSSREDWKCVEQTKNRNMTWRKLLGDMQLLQGQIANQSTPVTGKCMDNP